MKRKTKKIIILLLLSPLLWPIYILVLLFMLMEEICFNIWLYSITYKDDDYHEYVWISEEERTERKKQKVKKFFILALLSPILWPVYALVLTCKLFEDLLFYIWLRTASLNWLTRRQDQMSEKHDECNDEKSYKKLKARMDKTEKRIEVAKILEDE